MDKFWFLLPILFMGSVFAESSVSAVIIGGGPAGLATAIEARQAGAQVTVVEKRGAYEREQTLFLFEHSLALLERWEVKPPELKQVEIGDTRRGFVQICALEEALLQRAQELGVCVIQDEFMELSRHERSVVLKQKGALPYDLLIAADGAHSQVRQALGIEVDLKGQGKAGTAFFPQGGTGLINVSAPIQHGSSFVRNFQFPEIAFIFFQNPVSAKQEDVIALCKASGWDAQAEQIAAGEALLLVDADVYLQQAQRFSLEDQRALLVGDAAGVGSFFQGRGANHALESAEIAGRLFTTNDYERFEAEMNQATSAFIENSAFLFM